MENNNKEELNASLSKNNINNEDKIKDEEKEKNNGDKNNEDKINDEGKEINNKDENKNEEKEINKEDKNNENKKDDEVKEINNEDEEKEIINNENVNNDDNSNKQQIDSSPNIINLNSIKEKFENDADNIDNNNSNLDLDIVQIRGEREKGQEDEYNSENNLFNLSSLFRDYINRIDVNKINAKPKRKKSIYKVRRKFRNNTINEKSDLEIEEENDSINLYNIIKDRLTEVKEDTLHYLDQTKKKLESKYNYYIKKINELLFEKEKQISKLVGGTDKNDNFINYANNNLFKKIDDVLEIHDYIFSALEDHFNLLFSFLEQSNLMQQKKPIEYFINNNSSDILNCWFLNKIDFNRINLSSIISNKELSDLCAGYISKMNSNIYPSLTIKKDKDGNLPLEIEILYKNVNKLNKIKFIGLNNNDISNILLEIRNKYKKDSSINHWSTTKAKKLKNLSIINSNLFIDNLPKITFPALKKFRLKKSFITFSYLFDYIFRETSSLIQIFIEDIKLTNNGLKTFFEFLSSKKSIFETLKNLSFKGNNLTKINFKNLNMDNGQLKNLQYLNFSKNNLYEFSPDNFKVIPELKVLDLTDNNISNSLLFESLKVGKKHFKFIVFLSNNIFIHNNAKNNYEYIKYLLEKLSIFEHKIKKISFPLLFNKNNVEHLTKIKISPAVKISICKLDLSFCGLLDENLWKFFRNNFGLLNLEELNLSNNFLTDNVFNLCSGVYGDILLEQLYMIDLSANQIECRNIMDLKSLDIFIDNHQELRRIKMQQNQFIQGLKKLIDQKSTRDEVLNIINKFIEKNIKFIIETDLRLIAYSNKSLSSLFTFKNKNY